MRWHCFHQSTSIGIPFRPIYFVSLKDIYQPALMHDANPVGKLADKVQIMGNEQTCSSGLLLQFYKKIGDRGLYRYVQRCGDFVTYYKFGFGCERTLTGIFCQQCLPRPDGQRTYYSRATEEQIARCTLCESSMVVVPDGSVPSSLATLSEFDRLMHACSGDVEKLIARFESHAEWSVRVDD